MGLFGSFKKANETIKQAQRDVAKPKPKKVSSLDAKRQAKQQGAKK